MIRIRATVGESGSDDAFGQWERDEKGRAEAALRNGMAILKAGIRADIAASKPIAVADKEERLITLSLPADEQFNALRVKQDEYYVRGRDKGIRIDLDIAIAIASRYLERAAGHDEAGAAFNDLGLALWTLGERESGTARLQEAVSAFRAALEERIRERVPLNWAMTQNNLGLALWRLGERESGTGRLEEAATAYRAALEERTRERVPLDWAGTLNNLGTALSIFGERESGTARLEEAVIAYRAALEERTRERVPLDWATTQNNLGGVYEIFADKNEAPRQNYMRSIQYLECALEVFNAADASHYMAIVSSTRDRVQAKLAAQDE